MGDHLSRRLWLLQSEALYAEARRRTRLEDFGDPSIEPALSILVNSLELEADLHPLGRFFMRVHLRELLETRLRLINTWSGQLEALQASLIQRPVFITGMPRSGSTFLHELLAEDPENRVPRVWEVMFPIPIGSKPPKKVDPRVRKAEASLWWFRRLAPGADSVYPMRACTPHECVAIHSYTLLSEEFVSICHIPTYEAFLHRADLAPTYRWQKRFLQYLQLGRSKRRWVLKSPDHEYGLDKLLRVFPDAVVIQTHRNPVQVVRSQIQLTKVLEGLFGRPGERDQLGMSEARKIGGALRLPPQAPTAGDLHHAQGRGPPAAASVPDSQQRLPAQASCQRRAAGGRPFAAQPQQFRCGEPRNMRPRSLRSSRHESPRSSGW